ncbi:U11/U12 small nuclear ribonucleoprotein 65 kDa protein isoform X2 [Henckelia pumila]|uniref:U11/U12 small nuclear ribonucleoprotein 65 kDa protein isoform X2 n=1 Tax=Henckelia pumila TaxID=405737 RepID=UPI003C6E5808
MAEVMGEEERAACLFVSHLPEAIPADILSRLFSHYGASSVRPARVKNCAFLDFKNETLAAQAQKHLHGLQFLGKALSVERARNTVAENTKIQDLPSAVKTSTLSKDFSDGFRRPSEPIAEKLGVDYSFPPHFEYAYPPPDGHILTNIVNALIAVPRFYTQVLHLMNKMNIPAPFRKALPTPPLPGSVPVPPPPSSPPPPPPPPLSSETNIEDLSGSESEMESSDEGERMPKRKRIKRQPIVGPAVNKDVAHETVGLKPAALLPKEKPILKRKNPLLQIRIAPKQIQPDKKDDDTVTELQETIQGNSDRQHYATLEELNSGKLPPEEILSLPRFKNYTTGDPAPVLYVKNLAKDVVVDDFYFIFGSFFGSIDEAKSNLLIKLMQEGRMRGQAFVTFPTVELAHNALNAANGYPLKGKPIVLQFGRSPASAKPTKESNY